MYHYSWCLIKFRTISTRFISLFFVACCLPSSRLLSCHHVSSHRVTVFHHVLAGLISSHVFSLNLVNLLKCCTSTHWNWCFNIFFSWIIFHQFSSFFIMPHHALAQFIIILPFVSCHHVPSIAPDPIAWYRALSSHFTKSAIIFHISRPPYHQPSETQFLHYPIAKFLSTPLRSQIGCAELGRRLRLRCVMLYMREWEYHGFKFTWKKYSNTWVETTQTCYWPLSDFPSGSRRTDKYGT